MFRSLVAIWRQVLFVVLALILAFVVIFSIPAEEEDTEHKVEISAEMPSDLNTGGNQVLTPKLLSVFLN